ESDEHREPREKGHSKGSVPDGGLPKIREVLGGTNYRMRPVFGHRGPRCSSARRRRPATAGLWRALQRQIEILGLTLMDPALRTIGPLLVAVFILLSSRLAIATEPEARETVLFNAGWRFQSGDPDGLRDSLDYTHLRSWLLPSGDACLPAEAGHHRPDGN